MSGNDRVISGGDLTAYGDVYAVRGGNTVSGGDDRFTGNINRGGITDVQLKGDAEFVSGGSLDAEMFGHHNENSLDLRADASDDDGDGMGMADSSP